MIPPSLGYFVACLVFFVVWLILFSLRKDTRREMLTMSWIIGIVSVLTLYFWYTVDWWHPLTITGTRIGVEDFIIGFASGGVMSVCYELVSGTSYKYINRTPNNIFAVFLLVFLAVLTSFFFYVLHMTSYVATVLGLSTTTCIMLGIRSDLIRNSLLSGVLSLALALPAYFLIIFLSPTWVASTYDWRYLSGTLILGIPVEELVFWFLSGLFFGPFYEFWKSGTLKRN